MALQLDKRTGYPSADKPWLKYYETEKDVNKIPSPDCSMISFLRQCNEENLKDTALYYFGTKISFKTLFEKVDTVSAALQKDGIKPGDIVSICGLNTPEFVYLMYAVNQIGAVSNELGLTSPIDDLKNQLNLTKSKTVFVIDVAYETILQASQGTFVEQIIVVPLAISMPLPFRLLAKIKSKKQTSTTSWKSFIKKSSRVVPEDVDVKGDDLAIIEYTGGSTGIPKGVMLSNRNLNSYYVSFIKTNQNDLSTFKSGETFLGCVPFFLAFGVSSGCHGPLSHSMGLILTPDPNPDTLGKMIVKTKPNHIAGGRIQIEGLIRVVDGKKTDLSFLRSVMYGGEAEDRRWEAETEAKLSTHRMKAFVRNGYGMTETSACILIVSPKVPNGFIPLGNVDAKITDPEDYHTELGYDVEGELCLSADTVMMGYYQNEEETAEIIFEEKGKRWLKTRDLAMISPDGTIHITGRIKRIYHRLSPENIGIRVYPMRIEEAISECIEVEKSAVVGVPDKKTAFRTIAFIILKNQSSDYAKAKERIYRHCREQLPESHIPDEIRFVMEYPLTRAGKIDYRALEKLAEEKR